jgi:hypothetical protein
MNAGKRKNARQNEVNRKIVKGKNSKNLLEYI